MITPGTGKLIDYFFLLLIPLILLILKFAVMFAVLYFLWVLARPHLKKHKEHKKQEHRNVNT